ncbi:MAG: hypothetical protein JRC77_00735 [Deltaproteobacteria bacterium]|nr:hypothetical protein [Deltaproteobacteria bacterium]
MWLLESGQAVGIEALKQVCRDAIFRLESGGPGSVALLLPDVRTSKRRRLAGKGSPMGTNLERVGYMQRVQFEAAFLLDWLEEQGTDQEARDRAFEGR